MTKCCKMIRIIKRLLLNIPCDAPFRIFKLFTRHHLNCGDINKPNNKWFENKLENIHYKACIAITGAIQGRPRERLYQEQDLESLENRRRYRKLNFFRKIANGATPT